MIGKADATAYLSARYAQQCGRFPSLRENIPVTLYIRRNLNAVLRNAREATQAGRLCDAQTWLATGHSIGVARSE